ncbi:hypothetical protein EQG68_00280 [Flavobacterium piscinae]|uniref:Lipoprotein n=2 Tax=Flavobacterium piscinae TaxID=2506424 RepID=A0A4Q1KZR3_9FLAO|nr:hypothetical protein [Flavobacterium piscinae]RXR35365.1 hypothetical protein EQG68_00280 [Flavobacterium piscinae]
MKKIHLISFILISFLFLSCANEEVQSIKVKGQYEIELPKILSKADNLHEDASLQYQNIFSEFYTIVIDEPIADFNDMVKFDFLLKENYSPDLNGYAYLLKDNLSAAIKKGKISPLESTKINGMEAKLMTVSGTVDGLDIYYQLGFFKGKEHYYQIVNWTEQKRKEDHIEAMEKIISSFKELNRNKKKIQ